MEQSTSGNLGEFGGLGGAPPAAAPGPRGRGFWGRLAMMEWLLKHRDYLLGLIENGYEVRLILADLALVSVLPTAFYGLVTGLATQSWVRIISNPAKVPLVLVATLCLCLPSLYIFSSYLGSRRSFLQTVALGFTATAIIGVILAAFVPITWFLTFTAPHSHALHVLVNVAVFGIAGLVGVQFLFQGARRLFEHTPQLGAQMTFLRAWVVLYGLVGLQMGYLFRPFFGASDVWITGREPGEESVFTGLGRYVQQLFFP
jgi:hypothetical protein